MEFEDYTEQQAFEFAKSIEALIKKVRELKSQGYADEAIQTVDLGLPGLLNHNIEDIISKPPDTLLPNILTEPGINNKNLDQLAGLFLETGHLFELRHDKETSKRFFTRSLCIYQYLLKAEVDFPYDRHLKIKELKELLLQ